MTGEDSRLVQAATSLDDLDVRIAVWEADCPQCGGEAGVPESDPVRVGADN